MPIFNYQDALIIPPNPFQQLTFQRFTAIILLSKQGRETRFINRRIDIFAP